MIKLLVCLDCGRIFQEPKQWQECHGLDYGPYEHFSGCPVCGGAYAETFECDGCNEFIIKEYIKTSDGKRYCNECVTHMELGDEN